MNKIIVAITTIIEPQRTINLLDKYLVDKDIDQVWIFDNGHKDNDKNVLIEECLRRDRSLYIDTRGLTLAQQWNKAILDASKLDAHLIISNDDVIIEGNLGKELSKVLSMSEEIAISYPDSRISDREPQETKGSKADHGMHGECFMIKSSLFKDMLVDESFTYWGLDDDIVNNAAKSGYKQFRVFSVSINSDSMGTTSTEGFEWMLDERFNDLKKLNNKWNIKR